MTEINHIMNPDTLLYQSPTAEDLKNQMCDIGHRIWLREYCDGNGGNISVRLAADRFLVTPTGVSKGFMRPEMICLVDGSGRQFAGSLPHSSEFSSHMAIYEAVPEAVSVCHAHPCHAGAFAVKGMEPPLGLIPELEIFVGRIPVAPYETPGTPEVAALIGPLAPLHQSIIMGCHGLICWGASVEDAYFKVEITDAYCRTLLLALPLPGNTSIPSNKLELLLARKKGLGLPDPRFESGDFSVDPWGKLGAR